MVLAPHIYDLMPSSKPLEADSTIKSISQKKKVKHKEVRSFIHGHTASRQRTQDSEASLWLQAVPGEVTVLAVWRVMQPLLTLSEARAPHL